VAVEVFRRYGATRLILLNHDINPNVEDADIKRFKNDVAASIGVPIQYANHPKFAEMDQFDVARKSSAFKVGSTSVICTHRLKTEPFHKWLDEHTPDKNCIIYYGFDASEMHRIQRRVGILGAAGYRTDYPLALWSRTIQSTTEIGVAPPMTYSKFKHANCTGCIKGGRQHWYVVYCERPDLFTKAKDTEDEIGYSILKDVYLSELEPMFASMKAAGVVASEHIAHQRFWVDAKRLVRSVVADTEDSKPCECFV
jgi:hypothetical protein